MTRAAGRTPWRSTSTSVVGDQALAALASHRRSRDPPIPWLTPRGSTRLRRPGAPGLHGPPPPAGGALMYTPKLKSRLAVEALGTFWLVFIGCGSAIFDAKFLVKGIDGQ